jgi:hypothetical protein
MSQKEAEGTDKYTSIGKVFNTPLSVIDKSKSTEHKQVS